jgi:protein-disulfide isomerase
MNDKKIIIIALILATLVIGGGWYYSKHGVTKTPISDSQPTAKPGEVTEPGINFGDSNAPVTMEIYTNLMCPACANFATKTFLQIKDEYIAKGKVKVIFYIFPPIELGYAAMCAVEQGKFLEFHDYIFGHQDQITGEEVLKTFAINAGLDGEKFSACYATAGQKYDAKINKWADEGQARTVENTPTFFINGQKFVGAQPYAEFQKLIEQKLNQ